MRTRIPIPRHIESRIKDQSGVISVKQLVDAGVSRKVIERWRRNWTCITDGLYTTSEITWDTTLWAGLLRAGPDGVAGGAAAAHLHSAVIDPPTTIHIWSPLPKHSFSTKEATVVFRRGNRSGRGTPPRTAIEESLLDLATHAGENDIIAAVTRALSKRLTLPERIGGLLDTRPRQRHHRLLRSLCDASSVGIESTLEWLFTHRVLVPHELPIPARQVRTQTGRVDALYDGFIVELDGERFHADEAKDRHRDNEHAMRQSLLTLRYGWQDMVDAPCRTAAQLRECLGMHGWTGPVRLCGSCPTKGSGSDPSDGVRT